MKKILVIAITIILLVVLYFGYVKYTCMKPYQEIFVISQDSSGVTSDTKQCVYVGWKSGYSKPVIQETNTSPEVQNRNTNPIPNTASTTSVNQTIPVYSSSSIKLLSPNGEEAYSRGTNVQVKWSVTNPNDIVRLVLIPGDINITSFANAGANFTTPYTWIIGSNINPGSYKIRADVYDQSGSVPILRGSDTSDNYFTITNQ